MEKISIISLKFVYLVEAGACEMCAHKRYAEIT